MPWGKLIDRRTSNTFQISEGLPTAGLAYTEAKSGKQKNNNGLQGSRSGESNRLPPMWPGIHFQSSAIRGLSLLLVLYSAPRGFSLGTPGFALSSKSSISKFQFDLHSNDKGQKQIIFLCHLLEIIEEC